MKKKWVAGAGLIKLISLALAGLLCAGMGGCSPKPIQEEKTVDTQVLRVGIISDTQLAPKGGSDVYDSYLKGALELLKQKEIHMLIHAGDYTDVGLADAYQNFKDIYEGVYPGNSSPMKLFIMGNHDYWLSDFVKCWEIPFKGKMRHRMEKYTGESPWSHKVLNGYHFIGLSPVNGSMEDDAYEGKLEWAEEEIQKAIAAAPSRPVFVITHNNPKDTVYTSDDYGDSKLDALFAKYPQVISISGHTHASILDERSISQTSYTAINTQSLSYTDFEEGALLEEPGDVEANPMCMIMEIADNQITIRRYSVLGGQEEKEPWVIPLPIDQTQFSYTDQARAQRRKAPAWPQDAKAAFSKEGERQLLTFPAATHEDFVHSYRIVLSDSNGKAVSFGEGEDLKEELIYISDFYAGIGKMSKSVQLNLADALKAVPAGSYTATIYAQESFGKESAPITCPVTVS